MLRLVGLAFALVAAAPAFATPAPYEGEWSTSAAACADSDGPNDTIRISEDRYTGYELHCRIRRAAQAGAGWRLHMSCEAEGERLKGSALVSSPRPDMLTVEQRLAGNPKPTRTTLVRCKAVR